MPNGGVPIQMYLRPKNGQCVIHCKAAEVMVYSQEEWDRNGEDARPVLTLTSKEAHVLSRFLRYWLHDVSDGPIYQLAGVDVGYDL